jgi:hypothetical protein
MRVLTRLVNINVLQILQRLQSVSVTCTGCLDMVILVEKILGGSLSLQMTKTTLLSALAYLRLVYHTNHYAAPTSQAVFFCCTAQMVADWCIPCSQNRCTNRNAVLLRLVSRRNR